MCLCIFPKTESKFFQSLYFRCIKKKGYVRQTDQPIVKDFVIFFQDTRKKTTSAFYFIHDSKFSCIKIKDINKIIPREWIGKTDMDANRLVEMIEKSFIQAQCSRTWIEQVIDLIPFKEKGNNSIWKAIVSVNDL